ncbi:hypothetical protein X948_5680 [Burkholderia pseudomallei MSHR5608]|nr:hypothetical protein X948_5680 [Burkholderia pseudomallei MSHR5608]
MTPGCALRPSHACNSSCSSLHDRLETARSHPAPRLLIDRLPRGQVIRQHVPRRAASDQSARRIEDLAEPVAALFAAFSHQCQIRHNERPFFVAYIARMRLAGFHPNTLPYLISGKIHNPSRKASCTSDYVQV